MHRFRWVWMATLLFTFSAVPARAQRSTLPPSGNADPQGELNLEVQRNMQKQRQKKRFEEMQRDSQKLLELATELKQYVDKSGEQILSVEVLRKAEEMEKLARRVKENMRGD
jgi:hypothetical protein